MGQLKCERACKIVYNWWRHGIKRGARIEAGWRLKGQNSELWYDTQMYIMHIRSSCKWIPILYAPRREGVGSFELQRRRGKTREGEINVFFKKETKMDHRRSCMRVISFFLLFVRAWGKERAKEEEEDSVRGKYILLQSKRNSGVDL